MYFIVPLKVMTLLSNLLLFIKKEAYEHRGRNQISQVQTEDTESKRTVSVSTASIP